MRDRNFFGETDAGSTLARFAGGSSPSPLPSLRRGLPTGIFTGEGFAEEPAMKPRERVLRSRVVVIGPTVPLDRS